MDLFESNSLKKNVVICNLLSINYIETYVNVNFYFLLINRYKHRLPYLNFKRKLKRGLWTTSLTCKINSVPFYFHMFKYGAILKYFKTYLKYFKI